LQPKGPRRLCFFGGHLRTIVYVDGFNLYYQIRHTGYKWLNISTMVRSILSSNQIISIKYYTARVKDRQGLLRQENYLRALATTPLVQLHFGKFQIEPVLLKPLNGGLKVWVKKTVEKQTDVNIGADMVHDAHLNRADCFVLLSNDSDQCRPIEILRNELAKSVVVINPNPSYPAHELHYKAGGKVINLNHKILQRSQFPLTLSDAIGTFSIPQSWYWPDNPEWLKPK
jgi:uncharacterized LabA/DUF88 family protein